MLYKWEKVKENTLKECDISKLTGLWFAVYAKTQTQNPISMQLNKVSENELEFKHLINGEVNHSYNLVQNYSTLQGKLDRIIDRGEYQLGYPWWVLHMDDDCLVVYQCLLLNDDPNNQNASEDVWTVYSRTKSISDENLSKARDLLLKSGAKIEDSDQILFKVIDEN